MAETQKHPKRLIEVDLPIRMVSEHSRREKSIRHGHISTMHLWWARRPLAACRAVACASLWPDPGDENCPVAFVTAASDTLSRFSGRVVAERPVAELCSSNWSFWKSFKEKVAAIAQGASGLLLREALIAFIADFANWDSSANDAFLNCARSLTQAAHTALVPDSHAGPILLDPFAGGGAIPLEGLRVGAESVASDLNPVAVFLNKVCLEDIPRHGSRLGAALRSAGEEIGGRLGKECGEFFPRVGGKRPIAYLFARTVLSEEPTEDDAPLEIPLIRSMWLAKRNNGGTALRWVRDSKGHICVDTEVVRTAATGESRRIRRPRLEVVQVGKSDSLDKGTTIGGAAISPLSGHTTPVESVRRQLSTRHGGTSDARLLAVVFDEDGTKNYRIPIFEDLRVLEESGKRIAEQDLLFAAAKPTGEINHLRGFINIVLYGITNWGHAFSDRQALILATLCRLVDGYAQETAAKEGPEFAAALQRCLALAVDRLADYNSALCTWRADGEFIGHTFGQGQALPMRLDFVEVNPLSSSTGDWNSAIQWVSRVCDSVGAASLRPGRAMQAPAASVALPDDSADLIFTDPPYYAAVPYADLSDFFYEWLRRSARRVESELLAARLTPKQDELVSLSHRAAMYREKDGPWFESRMKEACTEARRIAKPGSVAVWVFANKETQAWEAMLAALIESGWIITASWPIDTEMEARLRARNSAALASSVHIVCRPRDEQNGRVRDDETGDWRSVLAELRARIHEWLPRLAHEGVVGADAIFACLGPALEAFSRYGVVEKVSGERVVLREYLEHVWATVSREALSMIFAGADTEGLEPDGRLTAMWLWTIAANSSDPTSESSDAGAIADEPDEGSPAIKLAGFVLEFDAARKIAQGLGARLEELTHLVELKGDKARLLPVSERANHLFGKAEGVPSSKTLAKKRQMPLFAEVEQAAAAQGWGEVGAPNPGTTTLDRVHQAMLLFGSGRSEALKRFLVEGGVGHQGQFWKLAQALSALYPNDSGEKRWVDGVLGRKKGLGFG